MIKHITLRGQPIKVWQVEDQKQAEQGLIGQIIDDDEGIVLPGNNGLHTVGVPHALDIVWFDSRGNVLAIDQSVPAGVPFIASKGPIVLELRGGWFARHPGGSPNAKVHLPQATAADVAMTMQNVTDDTLRQIIALHHGADASPGGGCPCAKPRQMCGCGCSCGGPAQVVGQSMIERHGMRGPMGMHAHGMMHAVQGGGGGHPHAPHGHGHHGGHGGRGWGGWGPGGNWPWAWCSPCDPYCPQYNPTLPCPPY